MKKIPLAFSGCLLGLAGAGNLLSDTFPVLAHFFSLTGMSPSDLLVRNQD